MIIRELTLDENPESGIHAISFVERPAIQTEFEYFADEEIPFFQFWADPKLIDTSHDFCRHAVHRAGTYYHLKEIQNEWSKGTFDGFDFSNEMIKDVGTTWFSTFNGTNSNVSGALYNCRHKLLRASSYSEIPRSAIERAKKKGYWDNKTKTTLTGATLAEEPVYFNFAISNTELREVEGLCLKSSQMIYRQDIGGQGPGYVYFTRDTVRKLHEKFGWNRSITFSHREECTGQAILLKSWIKEDDEHNCTEWYLRYKIIGSKLWEQVKTRKVRGFSAELLMNLG